MKAKVFCIAATLAGLAGTARADGPAKPRLRFWGVEVRDGNNCAHSVELDTAIADQLEQLGKPVLTRPMGGNFRAGCVGLDCVSQWPPPPPVPAMPGPDPSRPASPEPDRMLGGSVEPSPKGTWRGRLWYYVAGVTQVAVRDVVAPKERLPTELAYAAAALVFAPDPKQTIASKPTFCSTSARSSQIQSPAKGAVIHIGIYRRPGFEPFALALTKGLGGLARQLGASARTVEYPKPRDKYMDKDEACKPEKKNGATPARRKQPDCPPPRPESGLIEVELVQGTDLGVSGNGGAALKEVRLRWRSAENRGEPRERPLAVPAGTSPEGLVRMVTAAIRPKLAGVVDGMEFSPDRGSLPKPELPGLCAPFSTKACEGGSNVADECKSGPEPPGCQSVFCGAHPEDKRCPKVDLCALGPEPPGCQAIYCASHTTDSRCACGAPGQPPCKPATDHSIRTRKAFTFVFTGLAAVSAGLFIWRATANDKFVGGDCALPDDMTATIKNSCVQRTWPSMLETGIPALILPGVAAAIWPYGQKAKSSAKQQDSQATRQ